MYRLGKRVISQFIRTGCRRRLRLDLYRGREDRRLAGVPEKDAGRPGLALLTQQGREYERAKFRELEEVFGDFVVRGELRPYEADHDRVFEIIDLDSVIDQLEPYHLALEAQYEITDSFRDSHNLAGLEDGTAVADGEHLGFEALRPDIIQVPTSSTGRTVVGSSRRPVSWIELVRMTNAWAFASST